MEKQKKQFEEAIKISSGKRANELVKLFAGMSWFEWLTIKDAVDRVFEKEKEKTVLEDTDVLFETLKNRLFDYEYLTTYATKFSRDVFE